MNKLDLSKEEAIGLYAIASPEIKKKLEDSFGKNVLLNLPQDITERVKTYEDALKITNRVDIDFSFAPEYLREYLKNQYMAIVVCEALNEGEKLNWMDANQKKWRPWFSVVSGAFVFDLSSYRYSGADACDAARLCLKNNKLSNYAGAQFTDIFANVLTK